MEPLGKKGDFLGIDTRDVDIVAGEIYAVHVPYEGLVLKQVFVDPEENRFKLLSVNPKHPETVPADRWAGEFGYGDGDRGDAGDFRIKQVLK